MELVKNLILGSAASLLSIGAAQPADLPVKAKAVEYVKICSAYGAGFWFIPGTDTCMKIGGYVAVEHAFLQFAGFTFGKSHSAYATPWQAFPGNTSSFLIGGHDTNTGVNNIQYTWDFGGGVSGSVGLDDPVVYNRTNVFNL